MKLVSYTHKGESSWGALTDSGIFDFRLLSGGEWPTLRQALVVNASAQLRNLLDTAQATYQLQDVVLQPVIPGPIKIICSESYDNDPPAVQRLTAISKRDVFARFPSTLVGHGQPVVRPADTEEFELRGRLAVIVGKAGRRIPRDLARDYVAGYAPFCDTSVSEWRREGRSMMPSMNFPMTCGIGPWMMARDAAGDEEDFHVSTRVNGTEIDRHLAAGILRDIAETVAYCSAFTPLEPGDILVVGWKRRTAPGSERHYLKPGDNVEVEVANIGTLYHPVVDEVR